MNDLDRMIKIGLSATPLENSEGELLRQISEHARAAAQRSQRRRGMRWLAGASMGVVLLAGASAAVASPAGQGALRNAGIIPAPLTPTAATSPVTAIRCAPVLTAAAGSMSKSSYAVVEQTINEGQEWLDKHALTVTVSPTSIPVPSPTESLTAEQAAHQQMYAAARHAEQTLQSVTAATSTDTNALQDGLTEYLRSRAEDPTLVTIEAGALNCGPSGK